MANEYDYMNLHISNFKNFQTNVQSGDLEVYFKDKNVKDTIISGSSTITNVTIVGEIDDISKVLSNSKVVAGTNYQEYKVDGKVKNAYLIEQKEVRKIGGKLDKKIQIGYNKQQP